MPFSCDEHLLLYTSSLFAALCTKAILHFDERLVNLLDDAISVMPQQHVYRSQFLSFLTIFPIRKKPFSPRYVQSAFSNELSKNDITVVSGPCIAKSQSVLDASLMVGGIADHSE